MLYTIITEDIIRKSKLRELIKLVNQKIDDEREKHVNDIYMNTKKLDERLKKVIYFTNNNNIHNYRIISNNLSIALYKART